MEPLGLPTWSQVRRAACSARRVKSHCFYACINILLFLTRGGPNPPKSNSNPPKSESSRRMLGPCWPYVGTFFALERLFFALGWFLSASCTFLAHVGRFFRALGRSGLDFGWSGAGFGAFKTEFVEDFWRSQARTTEMLFMQQNHNFCYVL